VHKQDTEHLKSHGVHVAHKPKTLEINTEETVQTPKSKPPLVPSSPGRVV